MPAGMGARTVILVLRLGALLALAWLSALPVRASEGPRLALVIGNSNYVNADPLSNPVNDAALVAGALGKAGFAVTQLTDLDQRGMKRAVRDFAETVSNAGEGAVALFYYAGHGLQVDGINYLVPVDADIEQESDVAIEAIGLPDIMRAIEFARAAMNIVVLDACRNNPLKRSSRSTARGLARVDAPTGSIVAYATAPGTTAADGTGPDSPYSLALAQTLTTPGMPIEQVFKAVRIRVKQETDDRQVPWESSSLTQDFYFVPGNGAKPAAPVAVAPAPPQASPPAAGASELAEADYLAAVAADTIEAYRGFLAKYPSSPRAAQVRRVLGVKVESAAWRRADDAATPGAYRQYLAAFPKGFHADDAKARIAALETEPAPPPARPTRSPAPEAGGSGGDCGAPHGPYRIVDIAANDFLAVRAAPNRNAPEVGRIPPDGSGIAVGDCTQVRGYRSPWCEVRYECLQGWAYSRYLANGNGGQASAGGGDVPAGGEAFRVTGVQSWDVLNMRSGPGTKYPVIVGIPPDGTGVSVFSCQSVSGYSKKWCQAAWHGYRGWTSACCLVGETSGRRAD